VPLEAEPIDGTEESVVLNGEVVPPSPTFIRNAATAGVLGAPGISLPMGVTHNGLPVGLELNGCPDGDHALLAVGVCIEDVLATRN
jgi:Asp-tRNA(Asn)/Glu-tRNA(Gln) amidotransferase A subunit family amidase